MLLLQLVELALPSLQFLGKCLRFLVFGLESALALFAAHAGRFFPVAVE